jgi:hypothetical protein
VFISNLNAKWMDRPVSFYPGGHSDTSPGKALTLRQILLEEFVYWFPIITTLKNLDRNDPEYEKRKKALKGQLAAYALNLLESRRGKVLEYSGLMQLDWDYELIKDYDIDELMQAIFDLPFIAFCGKSCTGNAFYAFALIAEPEKLKEYAEHCFQVFDHYGIPVDTSKGRNYNDLRYVSYDCRMMIKDNPIPLKIKKFHTKKPVLSKTSYTPVSIDGTDRRIIKGLQEIAEAPSGNRWPTVRKVAYTLGGIQGASVDEIRQVIKNSSQYAGYEPHCIKCAEDSFNAGRNHPFQS